MRFMMLVKSKESSGPPPKALMDAMAKLGEEATKAGSMIESGGLAPAPVSVTVIRKRNSNKQLWEFDVTAHKP